MSGHSCHDEHGDHGNDHGHDHDHDHGGSSGPAGNLYEQIDHPNVVALNAQAPANICKPWHERMDNNVALESDADDQLIIRIPFTASVKLKAILMRSGPGDETPQKIQVFANEESLDFDDISSRKCIQEFDIPQSSEVGEYAVKPAKFSSVRSLTIFIPASQGADSVRVSYLGFVGSWTEMRSGPVIAVYEANANLADHEKIRGTEGNFNQTQF